MKPVLKVFMGLPASGKSTFSQVLKDYGFYVHSSDELRVELYGDVNTFDKNGELFNELHRRIKTDLQDGKNVVFDATNINRKKRMAFLSTISKIDCRKELLVFATPYNMCVQLDKLREKKAGYQVIKNMYMSFQMPMLQEGWDSIKFKYHPDIDWDSDEYNSAKQIVKLMDFNQFNEHHKLTLGNHIQKVGKILLAKKSPLSLSLAGFLHDLGKAKTMSFLNSSGEFSEYAHYYSHESVSAYDAMFYIEQVGTRGKDIDYGKEDKTLEVLNYVAEHMQPHLLKDKALEKYKTFVGEEFWKNLEIFHQADVDAKS